MLTEQDKENDFATTPAHQTITLSRSNSESADSVVTSEPAKKAKIPHSTATAMQLHLVAALEKMNEYNTAFKRATVVYHHLLPRSYPEF